MSGATTSLADWLKDAADYADRTYAYSGMLDDAPEFFEAKHRAGATPQEAVDEYADDCDMDTVEDWLGP